MNKSFEGLGFGILFAIVLVYFLMVVNFQSWTDPFIIIMALPGALCGIIWILFITGTTLNVPSLMGAIMAIGVATANSILVVTFANDERCEKEGLSAHDAALAAGYTRLRPVIMTALAMIIGMLPMALGLGEGGEQNAPLGRAVIGGLLVATFATLFFVPVVYSYLRRGEFTCDEDEELQEEDERESQRQPQPA
jgi:multidrug efflux pump subunit AcrB